MSAPRTILACLPSFCQKYQNWWKFDEVLTKTNFVQFFETRCTVVEDDHVTVLLDELHWLKTLDKLDYKLALSPLSLVIHRAQLSTVSD